MAHPRNPSSRISYALVKVRGKQFRQSLKTKDLPEAILRLPWKFPQQAFSPGKAENQVAPSDQREGIAVGVASMACCRRLRVSGVSARRSRRSDWAVALGFTP